jgi:hypothetical protein
LRSRRKVSAAALWKIKLRRLLRIGSRTIRLPRREEKLLVAYSIACDASVQDVIGWAVALYLRAPSAPVIPKEEWQIRRRPWRGLRGLAYEVHEGVSLETYMQLGIIQERTGVRDVRRQAITAVRYMDAYVGPTLKRIHKSDARRRFILGLVRG